MRPEDTPISPISPQGRPPRRGSASRSARELGGEVVDGQPRGRARRLQVGDVVAAAGHDVEAGGAGDPGEGGPVAAELVERLVDHGGDRRRLGVEAQLGDRLVGVGEAQVGAVAERVAVDALEVGQRDGRGGELGGVARHRRRPRRATRARGRARR